MSGEIITVAGISNVRNDIMKKLNLIETQLDYALMRGGMIVEGRAKELCPVDTGRLRASITTHAGESEEPTVHEVCVGTNVEYASYVELGTVKMSAQPYLRPALDECKGGVVQEIIETIKETLK